MDPFTTVVLISTVFLLVSTSFSLSTALGILWRQLFEFPHKIHLFRDELKVIRSVVDECSQTIEERPIESPPHIKGLLIAAHEQVKEAEELVTKVMPAVTASKRLESSIPLVMSMSLLFRTEKDLTSAVTMLRDKFALLRDACSE